MKDKNTKTVQVIEDSEETEKEFKDILDALKDGMKVFKESDYHLDANFLWCAKPDEKWQNFHTRQHIVAKKIERSFMPIEVIKFDEDENPLKDENGQYVYEEIENPLAKKAFLLVMMPSNDRAIMTRNDPANMIMKGILTWGDSSRQLVDTPEEEVGGGLMPKKITQFFKKKKREETIIGE